MAVVSRRVFSFFLAFILIWGDDTKVSELSGSREPKFDKAFNVNSHRLSGWKTQRWASGHRSKGEKGALHCLISIAKQSFSDTATSGHLENRVPAHIAECASIAAASRGGQFARGFPPLSRRSATQDKRQPHADHNPPGPRHDAGLRAQQVGNQSG